MPTQNNRPRNSAKYTGILSRSLPWDVDDIGHELTTRMHLLFDHFGVARENWSGLAMALAMAHVPGFQHSRRGRKPSRKLTAKRFRQWWDAQPNKLAALATLPEQLAEQAIELGKKPRVGRPKSETSWLVREADKWLQAQREAGNRRVSDRKFVMAWLLEIQAAEPAWLGHWAKKYRTTKAAAMERKVKYWTVRLSRARKTFSKP